MTLGDFYDCLDGYQKRLEEQMRSQDSLNHILGQYVALGVHASSKNPYPKQPLLSKDADGKTKQANKGFTTDSELDAYFTAMAKATKGGK